MNQEYDKLENLNHIRYDFNMCREDLAFFTNFMKKEGIPEEVFKFGLQSNEKLDNLDQYDFNKLKLPKIDITDKIIPSFSDCLTLKYNERYGRHVVATRDIRPGEIVVEF